MLKRNDDLIYKVATKNHSAILNSYSNLNEKLNEKQILIGQVDLYLEKGMEMFNHITIYEAGQNIHLLEIKKLCPNLKILSMVRYISVRCITDTPLKIERLVIKNFDNMWNKIYLQHSLKIYSDVFFKNSNELNSGNLLIKVNTKISEKHNKTKNIIKFNLIILFIILVAAIRKIKIKF